MVAEIAVGAPIKFGEPYLASPSGSRRLPNLDGFSDDFLADAVAGNDGNAFALGACRSRSAYDAGEAGIGS